MTQPTAAELRGSVLKAWRSHAGVSQRELADRVNVSQPTLAQWELGRRATRATANAPNVRLIAEKLELIDTHAAALVSMWDSAGSVTATTPASLWQHNFEPPSRRCWAWLRVSPDVDQLKAWGWWGEPLQGLIECAAPAAGLFVQLPTSIPNPPLEIRFAEPDGGWADFGWGEIPADVAESLGAVVIDGKDQLFLPPRTDPPLRFAALSKIVPELRLVRSTGARIGLAWRLGKPHVGQMRTDKAPHALDATSLVQPPREVNETIDREGGHLDHLMVDARTLRGLREARGLSRDEVVAWVNRKDPDNPLTLGTLRALENGDRTTRVLGLASRLDMLYGRDGKLGITRSFGSTGSTGEIAFDEYWVGPIWVQVLAPEPGDLAVLTLIWGDWRRRQHVQSGHVLTTRKALEVSPPLLFRLPTGWSLSAGLGYVPSALDINHGWYPRSLSAAGRILRDNVGAIRTQLSQE